MAESTLTLATRCVWDYTGGIWAFLSVNKEAALRLIDRHGAHRRRRAAESDFVSDTYRIYMSTALQQLWLQWFKINLGQLRYFEEGYKAKTWIPAQRAWFVGHEALHPDDRTSYLQTDDAGLRWSMLHTGNVFVSTPVLPVLTLQHFALTALERLALPDEEPVEPSDEESIEETQCKISG